MPIDRPITQQPKPDISKEWDPFLNLTRIKQDIADTAPVRQIGVADPTPEPTPTASNWEQYLEVDWAKETDVNKIAEFLEFLKTEYLKESQIFQDRFGVIR